ncbi:hypothetical protein V8C26DRAFT_404769 [Trichoderma gracile]
MFRFPTKGKVNPLFIPSLLHLSFFSLSSLIPLVCYFFSPERPHIYTGTHSQTHNSNADFQQEDNRRRIRSTYQDNTEVTKPTTKSHTTRIRNNLTLGNLTSRQGGERKRDPKQGATSLKSSPPITRHNHQHPIITNQNVAHIHNVRTPLPPILHIMEPIPPPTTNHHLISSSIIINNFNRVNSFISSSDSFDTSPLLLSAKDPRAQGKHGVAFVVAVVFADWSLRSNFWLGIFFNGLLL